MINLFEDPHDSLPVDESISMPASMDSWDALISFIEQQTENSSLSAAKRYGIKLAVEELLSNIIRSNSSSLLNHSPSTVEVFRFTDPKASSSLFLQIQDNGLPFDPHFDSLDESFVDVPLHERTIGGLGLLLVKKSVDSVSYQYRNPFNVYRLLSADSLSPIA